MKIIPALLFLSLTACAQTLSGYKPNLSEAPNDASVYESDRASCFIAAEKKWAPARDAYLSGGNTVGQAFGLLGGLAQAGVDEGHQTAGRHTDYYKMPAGLADECMAAKGYKVIPR